MHEKAAYYGKAFEQLSTHELEEILRADLNTAESGCEDSVYQILTILEKREQAHPTGNTVDAGAAWKSFQENYNTAEGEGRSLYPMYGNGNPVDAGRGANRRRRKCSFLRGTAIAAAVLCVLLAMIPAAASAENPFVLLGRWTDSIFHYVHPEEGQTDSTVGALDFCSDNEDLTRVFRHLADLDVQVPVVPTWIPDGFTLEDISVRETPLSSSMLAIFYRDSMSFTLEYTVVSSGAQLNYEKDAHDVTKRMIQGIPHYFFHNNGQTLCTWAVGNVECIISGNIPEADLGKIVNSIYTEEDSYEKTD